MNQHDLEAELERHHTAAFGWALSCVRWTRDEAEDVLQASYLKVLDGRARFDGRSTFRTWLFGVIRRTAAEQRRRALAARLLGLRWLQGGEAPANPRSAVDELVRSESEAHIRGALNRLSERQRGVLHLVFYEDLSLSEAATVLRISLGSARRHYERAKTRLRSLLSELNSERNQRSRPSRPVPAS